ncbi:MAG: glycoside hydrolase family 16 protein [Verrucomicrobiota bacterium]
MNKQTLTIASMLVTAPLAAVHAEEGAIVPSVLPSGAKWKLVFHDEFEGNTIDWTRWKASDHKDWVHPEFKTRQAPENCALDGEGHLVIRISRDPDGTIAYNHGLQTRDFQKAFGYIEARVQFSTQPGWWGHVCLIRNNTLTNYGDDPFENPQEFDIFEDYYKPKMHPHWPADRHNVISQAFHATVPLGFQDQGDGSGVSAYDARKKDSLSVHKLGRVLRHEYFKPTEYGGWHTVGLRWGPLEQVFYLDGKETLRLNYKDTPITTVPQKLLTGGVFMTPNPLKKDAPNDAKYPPFYGWLEDAQLPDQLVVDYLRWYEEDLAGAHIPVVTVDMIHDATYPTDTFPAGAPLKFRVRAENIDGKVQSIQLFSKGYLRGEMKLGTARSNQELSVSTLLSGSDAQANTVIDADGRIDQTFTVDSLFEGTNTVLATAVDNDGHVGISAPLRIKIKPAPPKQGDKQAAK